MRNLRMLVRLFQLPLFLFSLYLLGIVGFAYVYSESIPKDFYHPYYKREFIKEFQSNGHFGLINKHFLAEIRKEYPTAKISFINFEFNKLLVFKYDISFKNKKQKVDFVLISDQNNIGILLYNRKRYVNNDLEKYYVSLNKFEVPDETYQCIKDYYLVTEDGKQEILNDFNRSLYFSITTITTLGFGDIVPITKKSRMWVNIEVIFGIVIIGLFINSIRSRND